MIIIFKELIKFTKILGVPKFCSARRFINIKGKFGYIDQKSNLTNSPITVEYNNIISIVLFLKFNHK